LFKKSGEGEQKETFCLHKKQTKIKNSNKTFGKKPWVATSHFLFLFNVK